MKRHESITEELIKAMAIDSMYGMSNEGACLACGHIQDGVEPDAAEYACDNCSESQVMGAQNLLFEL